MGSSSLWQPTVYVSENAISSNTAGDSTSGSEQTIMVAIAVVLSMVLALGLVAQFGSGSGGGTETSDVVDGPTLSYYIQKFKGGTEDQQTPGVVVIDTVVSEPVGQDSSSTLATTNEGIVSPTTVEEPVATGPEAQ